MVLLIAGGMSFYDALLHAFATAGTGGLSTRALSIGYYNSAYIEGIGNIYEFDCGELSGWLYKVNGNFPSYGCSRYKLKPGDKVEWVYTCDLGNDVGGYSAGGQKDE